MRYGIVDIGSNTIRFKIYDYKKGKIKNFISKKRTASLVSYKEDGKLNEEGIHVSEREQLGPVVGTHLGPEAFGVIFVHK